MVDNNDGEPRLEEEFIEVTLTLTLTLTLMLTLTLTQVSNEGSGEKKMESLFEYLSQIQKAEKSQVCLGHLVRSLVLSRLVLRRVLNSVFSCPHACLVIAHKVQDSNHYKVCEDGQAASFEIW
jgi:hypothetical protein